MEINKSLLDNLLEQAAASPRLRMNYDLRTSATSAAGSGTGSGQALSEDNSQRMLNALLPGTVLPIHRHTKTTEVLVLLRGKMEEIFYEEGFESVWDGARAVWTSAAAGCSARPPECCSKPVAMSRVSASP